MDNNKAQEAINYLFNNLVAIFPAFKQAWPDQNSFDLAKANWIKGMIDAGINTRAQIDNGLKKCRTLQRAFAPSVGEFIAWCNPTPKELGFMSVEEAYNISIMMNRKFSDFSHPMDNAHLVIRHAIQQIGSFSYREMGRENSFRTFKRYYELSIEQWMRDGLKDMYKALPEEPSKPPVAPGVTKTGLDAIRALRAKLHMEPSE